ncbi:hypothetical protein [Amycolatopsis sp. cmx-4-83]|uniref:hypothetical protein n=1 Tax=Amycolatopsis sp. cmx-4-83 TaxID=2790940 RepID=UPI00397A4F92
MSSKVIAAALRRRGRAAAPGAPARGRRLTPSVRTRRLVAVPELAGTGWWMPYDVEEHAAHLQPSTPAAEPAITPEPRTWPWASPAWLV